MDVEAAALLIFVIKQVIEGTRIALGTRQRRRASAELDRRLTRITQLPA